jgi:hypothetical protein
MSLYEKAARRSGIAVIKLSVFIAIDGDAAVVRGRMVMDIFLQYCSVSVVDVPAANRK